MTTDLLIVGWGCVPTGSEQTIELADVIHERAKVCQCIQIELFYEV